MNKKYARSLIDEISILKLSVCNRQTGEKIMVRQLSPNIYKTFLYVANVSRKIQNNFRIRFSAVHVDHLFSCLCSVLFILLLFFLVVIVLSVLLQFTAPDLRIRIFKI